MTKLVVVLAVVVVVILVIVIIAARSMRAEDPEEFADRPGGRDDRDMRYQRRDRPAGRGGPGGRPSQRPGGSAGRGYDQRRDRGYDQRGPDGRGFRSDREADQYPGRGYDERRGMSSGSGQRSRGEGSRDEERHPRQARGRRSGNSSEWDSSEWEKLSDVDYWAELASDKPLTTTAQPAAQPSARAGQARSGPDRNTDALTRGVPAPGAALRQDPASGLPVRGRPQPADVGLAAAAAGRADFAPAPVPISGALDPRPAPAAGGGGKGGGGDPRISRLDDPASLPGRGPSVPPGRPRVNPDDDPLTSPSFPKIPADDSRSYRNGRTATPPRGSSVPSPYMAPTQQFASYGPPAASFSGKGGADTDPTHPNGYRPDPLSSREAYPAQPGPVQPAPVQPAPVQPAPAPTWPASTSATTAGNPYGSYVTPDSQATVSGYSQYPAAHASAHGPGGYLPPAQPAAAGPSAGNGYWQSHPSLPGGIADPGVPDYPDRSDPLGTDSHRGSHRADVANGYGNGNAAAAHDPAGYPPGGYPPGQHDPAGYAPLDPYERDGYGGYPGYGAAGR